MLCNAVKEYVAHVNRMAGVETKVLPAEEVVEPEVLAESSEKPATPQVNDKPASQESKPQTKVSSSTEKDNVSKEVTTAISEGYTIQLLASDKKVPSSDSQFKIYRGKVDCYVGSGVLKYKYC